MFTFRDHYGGNNHSADGVTYCEIAVQVSLKLKLFAVSRYYNNCFPYICRITSRFEGDMDRLFKPGARLRKLTSLEGTKIAFCKRSKVACFE